MWCIGASGLRATNANIELSFTVYWLTVSHFIPAHHIGKTSQLILPVCRKAKPSEHKTGKIQDTAFLSTEPKPHFQTRNEASSKHRQHVLKKLGMASLTEEGNYTRMTCCVPAAGRSEDYFMELGGNLYYMNCDRHYVNIIVEVYQSCHHPSPKTWCSLFHGVDDPCLLAVISPPSGDICFFFLSLLFFSPATFLPSLTRVMVSL